MHQKIFKFAPIVKNFSVKQNYLDYSPLTKLQASDVLIKTFTQHGIKPEESQNLLSRAFYGNHGLTLVKFYELPNEIQESALKNIQEKKRMKAEDTKNLGSFSR